MNFTFRDSDVRDSLNRSLSRTPRLFSDLQFCTFSNRARIYEVGVELRPGSVGSRTMYGNNMAPTRTVSFAVVLER